MYTLYGQQKITWLARKRREGGWKGEEKRVTCDSSGTLGRGERGGGGEAKND